MARLYTRTGDDGSTALGDGSRVSKDHPRIAAYGDLDELNSLLGWCRAAKPPAVIADPLPAIQSDLLVIGAELCGAPGRRGATPATLGAHRTAELEKLIDEAWAGLPPLRDFILPAGTEAACRLHVARAVCRRAERGVIALSMSTAVRPEILAYMNRLSDLLFAWARLANFEAGSGDEPWTRSP